MKFDVAPSSFNRRKMLNTHPTQGGSTLQPLRCSFNRAPDRFSFNECFLLLSPSPFSFAEVAYLWTIKKESACVSFCDPDSFPPERSRRSWESINQQQAQPRRLRWFGRSHQGTWLSWHKPVHSARCGVLNVYLATSSSALGGGDRAWATCRTSGVERGFGT